MLIYRKLTLELTLNPHFSHKFEQALMVAAPVRLSGSAAHLRPKTG